MGAFCLSWLAVFGGGLFSRLLSEATMGKFIKLDNGGYGFQDESVWHDKPKKTVWVWPLSHWKIGGMGCGRVEDAIGKDATSRGGTVSVYLGNGTHLTAWMPEGDQTKALTVEEVDIPCPKVRAGMETRWHSWGHPGRWEKYTKTKGWIPA